MEINLNYFISNLIKGLKVHRFRVGSITFTIRFRAVIKLPNLSKNTNTRQKSQRSIDGQITQKRKKNTEFSSNDSLQSTIKGWNMHHSIVGSNKLKKRSEPELCSRDLQSDGKIWGCSQFFAVGAIS